MDGSRFRTQSRLRGLTAITYDTTVVIGSSDDADFSQPGEFTAWINHRRIMPGVTVNVSYEDGTYSCNLPVTGHPDGAQIIYHTNGLNGSELVGSDFAALDEIWVGSRDTGITTNSRNLAKAACEAIIRAKYKVIFEFDSDMSVAFQINNRHSGNWDDAPCLWINVGDTDIGVSTGGDSSGTGSGPAGVGQFTESWWHGFSNVNLLCNYGGVHNIVRCGSSFATTNLLRSDFYGTFRGPNCILIGGEQYGWRGNHGGAAWLDTPYIRGCGTGAEPDNISMFRFQGCDIQYNYVGINNTLGGSGMTFEGTVKNNYRYQMGISRGGAIDCRSVDIATTALDSGGNLPYYGILCTDLGVFDASGADTVITGHTSGRDIYLTGNAVVYAALATYGGATTVGNIPLLRDAAGILRPPSTGRPGSGTAVEMDGTTLTLPDPCPYSIRVIQPSGAAGTPISIETIVFTNFPVGESVTIGAEKASTGEKITVVEGAQIALKTPKRRLIHAFDQLTLFRPLSSVVLIEESYKINSASGGAVLTTTNATVANLIAWTLEDNKLYRVRVSVLAQVAGGGNSAIYELVCAAKCTAGTAALIGSVGVIHSGEDDAAWACTIDVTGAQLRVRVTGALATNINWEMVDHTFDRTEIG